MKKYRSITNLIVIFIALTALLSGCGVNSTGDNQGFFNQYLVEPITQLINLIANTFSGSYGVAIIIVTILIRLIMMPSMLKQYKNQTVMKEKMAIIKPEMELIQKKITEETDPKKKQDLQREMMGLYRQHGVNPLNMGCLPLLIQMPILTGLYYAIRSSAEISHHTFLWFSLGHPDLLLTIIAGVIYFVQFIISQLNMTGNQQQQMKFMGLISPIMIVVISFRAPAALPLYWAVGGIFLAIQSFIGQRLYRNKSVETVVESKQI
ncbi:membrane protein insertase YidC [Bacillus sp. REN16]|uniref:membrane protein insertase YidC n=1 Tax=Bacillus sp. REN16 TaxID=2887296 RepID=UPI001E39FD3C|nr:membrane protein insertase YidC [Bacillus sp. REN16]MCC3357828.1 membrane protein insertase YidC [Bacillus sp. REN16]